MYATKISNLIFPHQLAPKKTNTKKPTQPAQPPKLDALGLSAAVAHMLSAKSGSKSRNLSYHFHWWGEGVFGILKTLQPEVGSLGVILITLHYMFIYLYIFIHIYTYLYQQQKSS